MAFPIYRVNKNTHFPYLHTGLIYNSVLFLCIVSIIIMMLFVYSVIDWINKIYGYMKKYKVIKYKLK